MKKTVTLLGSVVIAALALLFAIVAVQATAQRAVIEPVGPDQTVHILGALPAGQLGSATAVGDINGDGNSDLIIAAPMATLHVAGETYTESGAVYLFIGNPSISHTWDLTTHVPNIIFYHQPDPFSGEWLGTDLATGDFNNDGFDDIVMGTPGFLPSYAGAATIFLGRRSITIGTHLSVNMALSSTPSQLGYNVRLVGAYLENRMGSAVAVGDLNGDGFDDLIAGAYDASPDLTSAPDYYPDQRTYHYAAPITRTQSGAVYVALGRSSWLTDTWHYWDLRACLREVTIYGDDSYDNLGRSVASGDLNNDGYDDIIVGANGADPGAPLTRTNAGEIYVFWGSSNITYADCSAFENPSFVYDHQIITDLHYITQTARITLTGVMTDDGAGYDLSVADLNQDDYDDIIIGAPGADPTSRASAGAAYLIYGRENFSPTISLSDADLTLSGAAAGDQLGRALAAADLNRDGYDDLLLGAPYADYSPVITDNGALYVLCGSDQLSGTLDLTESAHYNTRMRITHTLAHLGFGPSGGDVDADGWPELLVGAPGYDPPGRSDAGAIYAIGPRFHLTPSIAVVQVGQPITYTTDLRTLCGALDVTAHPSTTLIAAPGAGGGWDSATFSATLTGTWTMTAAHRGLTTTALLTVTPGVVARVVISPAAVTLNPSETFTFTARAYNAYDYLLTGVTFSWDLAHGGGVIHPSQGMFTATIADQIYSDTVVARASGVTGTATVIIINLSPVAIITGLPLGGDEGQTIQLDGTLSHDPNADPLAYAWDAAYIPPTLTVVYTSAVANHTWGDNGVYTLALRVTDDNNAQHLTTTLVTINNVPPTANANGPYTVTVNEVVTLTGSATDPGGSFDPLAYTWDLDNDGAFETLGQSALFSKSVANDYTITLRVTDDDGGQDIVTTTVTVRPLLLAGFQITMPAQGWINEPFSITVTALDNLSRTLTSFDGYGILSIDGMLIASLLNSPNHPAISALDSPTEEIKFNAGVWQGQLVLSQTGMRRITITGRDSPDAIRQADLFIYGRIFLPLVIQND